MKKKKGQALVETAFIIPIFLLFFCGIIDFGRVLHAGAQLNLVTQESVRLAGLGKKDSEVTGFAYDKISFSDKAAVVVNITPNDLQRKSGDYVAVKLTYDLKFITPMIKYILPSPFKVQAQSTIRVE